MFNPPIKQKTITFSSDEMDEIFRALETHISHLERRISQAKTQKDTATANYVEGLLEVARSAQKKL